MVRRIYLLMATVLADPAGASAGTTEQRGGPDPCLDACAHDGGECQERRSCEAGREACLAHCHKRDAAAYPPSTGAMVALFLAMAWLLLTNLWLIMVVISVARSSKCAPPGGSDVRRDP